jgi:hypothetical protein
VVLDLGDPLAADIFEGGRINEGEGDDEDVGARVGEGTQTIVVLLTGRIPETETHGLSVAHGIGGVVIKPRLVRELTLQKSKHPVHCGHVFRGELICCVTDQQTSLTDCTISDNNTLYSLHD